MKPYRNLLALSLFSLVLCLAATSRAAVWAWTADLNGPNEFPANNSPGTGFGSVIYDDFAHTLTVHAVFTNLTGNTTASHIHSATTLPFAGTAGVATTTPTFAGFPLGVTFGTYDRILDLTQSSSFNPSFVTANGGTLASAEAALIAGIASGRAYLNIHSTTFGGGEIRGFLIPEPSTAALIIGGVTCAWLARRRKISR